MKNKKYLVTNNGEGSICVSGRTRIDIPGLCKDMPLELPEVTAKATVARLKQRYPLLVFKETDSEAEKAAKTGESSGSQTNKTGEASGAIPNNKMASTDSEADADASKSNAQDADDKAAGPETGTNTGTQGTAAANTKGKKG